MFRANVPGDSLSRIGVTVLLAVALMLRLGYGLTRPADEASLAVLPDQIEYLHVGRSLLHGDGLVFSDARFGQEVRAYRMPGYPALIAACGGTIPVVRAVQAVLDTSTVLAIVLLAHRLLPSREALLAGWLTALNPFLIFFSGLLLSETLFIALLAWGTAWCFGIWRRSGGWWIGIVVLVASVLVRPAGIGLPLLIGGFAVLLHNRHPFNPGSRWPLPPMATVLFLMTLALLPWTMRNWYVVGSPIPTTTNTGVTLYDGLNPDATGASDQTVLAMLPQLRRMDEVERNQYLAGRAMTFVSEHPWRAAELALVKAGRTWSPVPLSRDFGGNSLYVVIAAVWAIPLFTGALIGVFAGRIPLRARLFLLLPALYVTLTQAVTVGSLRYRLPVEPFLGVLAAIGVHGILHRRAEVLLRRHHIAEERQTDEATDVLVKDAPASS